jgi:hypothetical protein
VLELFDVDGNSIGFNNNWKETQQGEIEATTIPPSDDLESAIVQTLNPGNYTAVVAATMAGSASAWSRCMILLLVSRQGWRYIATRGFVDRGDNVMIGGFIIGGGLGHERRRQRSPFAARDRAITRRCGSRERAPGSDTRAGERQRRHDRDEQ